MENTTNDSGGGSGENSSIVALVGILAIVVIALLFFFYALPRIRGTDKQEPQITIPDTIHIQEGSPTGQ